MIDFYKEVIVYLVCFIFALFGLSGLDFNKAIKQGKIAQAYILYFLLACAIAYLSGQFLMSIIYYFR